KPLQVSLEDNPSRNTKELLHRETVLVMWSPWHSSALFRDLNKSWVVDGALFFEFVPLSNMKMSYEYTLHQYYTNTPKYNSSPKPIALQSGLKGFRIPALLKIELSKI
ncbi:hypothetical protein STEG23_034844, partial [Scotinomys teguina]